MLMVLSPHKGRWATVSYICILPCIRFGKMEIRGFLPHQRPLLPYRFTSRTFPCLMDSGVFKLPWPIYLPCHFFNKGHTSGITLSSEYTLQCTQCNILSSLAVSASRKWQSAVELSHTDNHFNTSLVTSVLQAHQVVYIVRVADFVE